MKTIILSIKTLLVFTLLTGVFYPLFITFLAQVFFPVKANGSLIKMGDKTVGSVFIGQEFDSDNYFGSRPSAINYNTLPSGASNYGLSNLSLKNLVNNRKIRFSAKNGLDSLAIIPSELLFSSGSGLDPHISPEAAFLQVDRIGFARHFNETQKQKLKQLIINQTEKPQFLFLGNERVNVLLLNLETNYIK